MKLTADDIHNWIIPYVQKRWRGHDLDMEQRYAIGAAHDRHHQKGTSAAQEAEKLNRELGLTDD